jgi:hypothetical protein
MGQVKGAGTSRGSETPMTTITGPMAPIRPPSADERLGVLDRMGAREGERFTRYRFPTADVVLDPVKGILWIAADMDPDPVDWSAVCGLISAVGFDDGRLPHRKDPGEPVFHSLEGIYTFRLEYV